MVLDFPEYGTIEIEADWDARHIGIYVTLLSGTKKTILFSKDEFIEFSKAIQDVKELYYGNQ